MKASIILSVFFGVSLMLSYPEAVTAGELLGAGDSGGGTYSEDEGSAEKETPPKKGKKGKKNGKKGKKGKKNGKKGKKNDKTGEAAPETE